MKIRKIGLTVIPCLSLAFISSLLIVVKATCCDVAAIQDLLGLLLNLVVMVVILNL